MRVFSAAVVCILPFRMEADLYPKGAIDDKWAGAPPPPAACEGCHGHLQGNALSCIWYDTNREHERSGTDYRTDERFGSAAPPATPKERTAKGAAVAMGLRPRETEQAEQL